MSEALVEKALQVAHGVIREVSLVLSGANPGAKIDFVSVAHGDGSLVDLDDEAIITTGIKLETPGSEEEEEEETLEHADDDVTLGDVFETLNDDQKNMVYAIVGQVLEGSEDELAQTSIESDEGDEENVMKKNVFDGSATEVENKNQPALTHDQFNAIMADARQMGSLKAAVIKHAGTYGIDDINYLFPDARNVTAEPTWISRDMEWVAGVLSGTRHTPFSRIRSLHADITADEARAKGYVTTAQKVDEVFPILRRITNPTTVYKKQKLDRDDVVDITDFNVVSWLKREMRVMLNEELARAILVGDGRAGADPDHIDETAIRPIWADDALFVTHKQVASTQGTDDLIDDLITARVDYRGSGSPSLFVAPSFLTAMLLLKDADGYRIYKSISELEAELRVKEIVEVPIMEGLQRTDTVDYNLRAIMVNLRDYTVGADKGGEINMFDDFDIDYNQYKYLIETRVSGAMVLPKAAVVLEQAVV